MRHVPSGVIMAVKVSWWKGSSTAARLQSNWTALKYIAVPSSRSLFRKFPENIPEISLFSLMLPSFWCLVTLTPLEQAKKHSGRNQRQPVGIVPDLPSVTSPRTEFPELSVQIIWHKLFGYLCEHNQQQGEFSLFGGFLTGSNQTVGLWSNQATFVFMFSPIWDHFTDMIVYPLLSITDGCCGVRLFSRGFVPQSTLWSRRGSWWTWISAWGQSTASILWPSMAPSSERSVNLFRWRGFFIFFFSLQSRKWMPNAWNSECAQSVEKSVRQAWNTVLVAVCSGYIVRCIFQGDVWICMELMDTSLDKFYKKVIEKGKTIQENILGKITVAVRSVWGFFFPLLDFWLLSLISSTGWILKGSLIIFFPTTPCSTQKLATVNGRPLFSWAESQFLCS